MKFSFRCLLILLIMMFFLGSSFAETAGEISPLPLDLSGGHVPLEENYTENSYQDDSITVRLESVLFDEGTTIHTARVKIADPSQLRTAVSRKGKNDKISTMARKAHAVVAIGGEYYSNEEGGYVLRMGEVQAGRKKPRSNRDMLCIDANGDFHILIRKNANADFTDQLKALRESDTALLNVFNFGPALVIDGELQEMPSSYKYNITGREPRCAIGQLGPLEYLLVVVDSAKRDGKGGLSVGKLAEYMYQQGCLQAYNLDGGNSALMVFHDANYSHKSYEAERAVSDIIYFATAIDFGLDGEE